MEAKKQKTEIQITMTEIVRAWFQAAFTFPKKPIYVWVIEYWNLRFVCNLVLGIWDLNGFQNKRKAEILTVGAAFQPTCLSRAFNEL